MLGDYIRHPQYGVGKVIVCELGDGLVYFLKTNKKLHDGAGFCPNEHGWWFSSYDIEEMEWHPPLLSLIERRQQCK